MCANLTQRRVSEQSFRQMQKMEAIGQGAVLLTHDFNPAGHDGQPRSDRATRAACAVACQAVKQAREAAGKAAKLTQQLLTFAWKQRLEPKRASLKALGSHASCDHQ